MPVTPVGSAANSPATTPVPTPTKPKQEVQKIVSKSIATSLATTSLPVATASLPNQTVTVTVTKKDNDLPETKESENKEDSLKEKSVETVGAKAQNNAKEQAPVVKTEIKEAVDEDRECKTIPSAEKKEVYIELLFVYSLSVLYCIVY